MVQVCSKAKVLRGRGLEDDDPFEQKIDQFELKSDITKQNQGNFGKYNIRVNDLKGGFLNIRYPSGAVIRPFPKQLVSTTFRNIIVQLFMRESSPRKNMKR
jgi:hypothetical protein